MEHIADVDQYILDADEELQKILRNLRNLIEHTVSDVTEHFKWSQPVYRREKDFCYLRHTKKHVNLGFFNFNLLDDPENLLEGSGKTMRHIKIQDWQFVDQDYLKDMIIQAAEL